MSQLTHAMNHGETIEKRHVTFTKTALSFEEQITKLQSKGMIIHDTEKVKNKLKIINYYRLEAYWFPFYNFTTEEFSTTVSFDLILKYYRFDNAFRSLVFQGITYIEIAFRTQFAYQISRKYGPHALLNQAIFREEKKWHKYINDSMSSYKTYNEKFLEHFRDKYCEELPPIWAHVEFMSFGDLIRWWSLLDNNMDKKNIVSIFQIINSIRDIKMWLDNLRVIRNYCAHHSRLWNRAFVRSIKKLKTGNNSRYQNYWNTDNKKSRRIFNSLIIIDHLLNSIHIDDFDIIAKTYELTQKYHIQNISEMGFTQDFTLPTHL